MQRPHKTRQLQTQDDFPQAHVVQQARSRPTHRVFSETLAKDLVATTYTQDEPRLPHLTEQLCLQAVELVSFPCQLAMCFSQGGLLLP
jgi:hypothetical protein